jgi:biopolymer transport protein ExbD
VKKARKAPEDPVELNMVPVMNLFLAMIPFLLSCAAFFHVAVINASVPALSEGTDAPDSEPKKELKKVSLNLQITKTGFVLAADGDQPPDELKKIGASIPMKNKQYDYERLAQRIEAIHDKYPKSDTIIILPDKEVIYDDIIKTMDATREKVLDDMDNRKHMFTNAVVTSVL